MRISEAELLFLTTVTRAPDPFGLFLKFPKGKAGQDVYVTCEFFYQSDMALAAWLIKQTEGLEG